MMEVVGYVVHAMVHIMVGLKINTFGELTANDI
jgi:hypothetical protein